MILVLLCCLMVVTIQAMSELSARAKHVQALYQGAGAFVQTQEWDMAIAHYHAALNYYTVFKLQESNEVPSRIWTELGKVYKARGLLHKKDQKDADGQNDFAKALHMFKKAISRGYGPAVEQYAIVLTECGSVDDADVCLKKICDHDLPPGCISLNELRTNVGIVLKERWMEHHDKRDREWALAWLKKAVDEGNLEAIEQQGTLYVASGDFKQAEQSFRVAIKQGWHIGKNLYNLGVCRQIQGDNPGAIRAWQMSVNLEQDASSAFALGHYYKAMGNKEKARAWFDKAAQYRKDDY